MAHKKMQAPAIRRFSFRHDPTSITPALAATSTQEGEPELNEAETQARTYREQLSDAEIKAGRKGPRVHTRRVRVLASNGVSPSKLMRPVTVRHELIRTFIFK